MSEAEGLLIMASSHLTAAELIVEAEGDRAFNGRMSAALFLLLGFAMELSLKAAYLHFGGRKHVAKNEIGHSLKKALAAAKLQGYPASDELTWIAEALEKPHRTNYFRYLDGPANVEIPEPAIVISALKPVISDVARLVYPDAAWNI